MALIEASETGIRLAWENRFLQTVNRQSTGAKAPRLQ